MNRYPSWLNILVVFVFAMGILLALPNIYKSLPSVQIANTDGSDINDKQIQEIENLLSDIKLKPSSKYIEDGRAVILFDDSEDQLIAGERF